MLLEKNKFYQNERMSLKFSINISDQLHTPQISLVGPKIFQYHQEMAQLTPLSTNLPFTKV